MTTHYQQSTLNNTDHLSLQEKLLLKIKKGKQYRPKPPPKHITLIGGKK